MKLGPWSPRFDRRTALGLGLALAAGALAFTLTRPTPTVPALAAGAALPAGVPLETLEITPRRVPDATGLVIGEDVSGLEGWTLAAPLAEGEFLVPSLLRAPERRERPDVLALSLARDRAALGDLYAGDRVDVYVTVPDQEGPAVTRLVAADVYLVAASAGATGLGGEDRVDLLLAVDDSLAAALVAARNEGDLDLVRVAR
jgi:pilus assembly protein CpaB